ncbi:hypothetical protein QFC24_006624 [Naganishia onofrii]|uniref:Uncharacterized protein n=1 Tax=Naganishia onofrii TaxID=1851511 RepID=A0ACC2X0C5_9TREE|nr:hypothetical protein QFC24_006624 [Naganishia onofrii]
MATRNIKRKATSPVPGNIVNRPRVCQKALSYDIGEGIRSQSKDSQDSLLDNKYEPIPEPWNWITSKADITKRGHLMPPSRLLTVQSRQMVDEWQANLPSTAHHADVHRDPDPILDANTASLEQDFVEAPDPKSRHWTYAIPHPSVQQVLEDLKHLSTTEIQSLRSPGHTPEEALLPLLGQDEVEQFSSADMVETSSPPLPPSSVYLGDHINLFPSPTDTAYEAAEVLLQEYFESINCLERFEWWYCCVCPYLTLGWHLWARTDETSNLRVKDYLPKRWIAGRQEWAPSISITFRKTNQNDRSKIKYYTCREYLDPALKNLKPIPRLLVWRDYVQASTGIPSAPEHFLFPSISASGNIDVEQQMAKATFDRLMRRIVEDSGLAGLMPQANFTAHCLRRGAALWYANFANPKWSPQELKSWGGWSEGDGADVLIKYILEDRILADDDMIWVDHPELDKSRIQENGKGLAKYQAFIRQEWETMQETNSLQTRLTHKQQEMVLQRELHGSGSSGLIPSSCNGGPFRYVPDCEPVITDVNRSSQPPIQPDSALRKSLLRYCRVDFGHMTCPNDIPAVNSPRGAILQWFRGSITHPASDSHLQHPYPLREWPADWTLKKPASFANKFSQRKLIGQAYERLVFGGLRDAVEEFSEEVLERR